MLNPNNAYGGHHPIIPVAKGITPSQPQADCGPINTKLMIASPAIIRTMRSTLCTFCFIASSPYTMFLTILSNLNPTRGFIQLAVTSKGQILLLAIRNFKTAR